MQTARLRQKTLALIRAKTAEVLPLRPHWTDRPDAPRIQYSAGRSGAALAVCAVAVMDDADPRREYYPSGFRKLAERYQERLLTTPRKRAPRPPTIYLRRETFLAIPEDAPRGAIGPVWREGDTVLAVAGPHLREYAVVIVDGRERIPKAVQKVAADWPGLSPVYYRLARYPKARAKNVARFLVGVGRFADAIWLLGGFPG